MKFTWGTGIVAASLTAGTAFAADIPMKAPPQALPSYYNWTGLYIGANAGYGWASGDGTITIGGASGPVSGKGNGGFGGVQTGYNWQTGAMVIGLETDIQFSGQKGNVTGNAGADSFTATSKVPWFGTIRGRVGYAFNRMMIYATGGGFYGEDKLEGTSSTSGTFSRSRDFITYTVGAGFETALWDHWTAKLEYLYVGPPNHVPGPPGTTAVTGSSHGNLVRAGLNYRF
jgi:outer membrane immunogenic protein